MDYEQRESRIPQTYFSWKASEEGRHFWVDPETERVHTPDLHTDFVEDVFTAISRPNFKSHSAYTAGDIPGSLADRLIKGLLQDCPALTWREAELLIHSY